MREINGTIDRPSLTDEDNAERFVVIGLFTILANQRIFKFPVIEVCDSRPQSSLLKNKYLPHDFGPF